MRPRVKICGITRVQDAILAVTLGADAIGMVFAAASPRRLRLPQALAIRAVLPPWVASVALFMDTPAAEVRAICAELQPDVLQFHGSEDDAFCMGFGRPWLKALSMQDATPLPQRLAAWPHAFGFVLDGHAPGAPGGQGVRFDWSRLPSLSCPWLLAGGLTPANVAQALRQVHPWGIDVASGVESSPGIKDEHRLRQFFREIRRASTAQDSV